MRTAMDISDTDLMFIFGSGFTVVHHLPVIVDHLEFFEYGFA